MRKLTGLGLALALVAAACGGGADEPAPAETTAAAPAAEPTTAAEPSPTTTVELQEVEEFTAGELGAVEVAAGDVIEIRSLNAITGDVAFLGVPNQRAVELAVADYGPVAGREVSIGAGLDDLCSSEGGQAAAQSIVADPSVVGVIGTSCSGAAVAASPLISAAGLVMISPSNTSPALTSDLAGTAGDAYHSGYYRTAHNDLYQGAAVARFVRDELGFDTAAAIHDGDPYTQGLAQAFKDAFEELGGSVPVFTAVNKGDTDMTAVLTEAAAGGPQAVFFPIFMPEGGFIVQQAGGVSGLEGVTFIAADGLLTDNFMELPEAEGVYLSGPDLRYGANRNSITGKTADDFLAAYEEAHGEPPSAAFWAHSYDAATMLLRAVDRVAVESGGVLYIDRARLRDELDRTIIDGIIGRIDCDAFGDCGAQLITVVQNADPRDVEAGKNNVVFSFAPAVPMVTEFTAGELGAVEVAAGDVIEIRSLNAITGDVAFLGVPNQRAVELAVADYGPVAGREVSIGAGLDDLCSSEGGQAAAQSIVADPSVVGVIGTSCSGAAVAASPLISAAGLVMISPSNTSPALTSDLAGTAGDAYHSGYYRTAHNDLYQGAAVARFVRDELGFDTAAAIHDGDPYTQGLAQAFKDAFEELGGSVPVFTAVNKGDTDMTAVLTEAAAGGPQAVFFPIFMPEGGFIVQQAGGVSGLEGVTFIAADGLLTDNFMELPEAEGVYLSGPDLRYGANRNSITGKTADDFLAAYEEAHGEPPSAAFWAHSYDAATMLLRAVDRVAVESGGVLYIDRARLRDELDRTIIDGIIGRIDCDAFGDCGAQLITVVQNADPRDVEAGKNNVVFSYSP